MESMFAKVFAAECINWGEINSAFSTLLALRYLNGTLRDTSLMISTEFFILSLQVHKVVSDHSPGLI